MYASITDCDNHWHAALAQEEECLQMEIFEPRLPVFISGCVITCISSQTSVLHT